MVYDYKINKRWELTFSYDEQFIKWVSKHIDTKEDCVEREKAKISESFDTYICEFEVLVQNVETKEVDSVVTSMKKLFDKQLEYRLKNIENEYSIEDQLYKIGFHLNKEKKVVTYRIDRGTYGDYFRDEDCNEDEIPYNSTVIYSENKWNTKRIDMYKDEIRSVLGKDSDILNLLMLEKVTSSWTIDDAPHNIF